MTVNDSGKLNRGGVQAVKEITSIPPEQRNPKQVQYLEACLRALKAQPKRWESYQDWGPRGARAFLKARGIDLDAVGSAQHH